MFNSFLTFCFWKACTFSGFESFLCWKSRNYSQIYLSGMINYWGSILTLHITWGAFSLVFFFLSFLFFFLFLSVFSLTDNKDSKDGTGEGIIIFLVFHFHPLINIHLVHRDFYHLFLIVIDFDISKLHCEDLGSYQTITFLLQSERLNKLTFTPLPTTAYLSYLPSPHPSRNLSSNRFSKCMKNKRCFIFLQEIGRRITKTNFGVLKKLYQA